MESESELSNLVYVWAWVFGSLCYCYVIGKVVPKGRLRFLALFPVVVHFVLLPRRLTSVNLAGSIGFWVGWLANFKLLLFAFGGGPLATDPSIALHRFVALACLPIKVRQPRPGNGTVGKAFSGWLWSFGTKGLFLAVIFRSYEYIVTNCDAPQLIRLLYVLQMYFSLEVTLGLVAALARALVQMDIEPQFDRPYLSTSLQQFWGRRWNLMVTNIMRPAVYDPLRRLAAPAVGRKVANMLSTLATFGVSALMHELIFHYLTKQPPTWEVTWFFVFHGVLLVLEVELKQRWYTVSDWRFPEPVSRLLAVGFMIVTGMYMFLPQLLRAKVDSKALQELEAVSEFARTLTRAGFGSRPLNATI